MTNVSRRSLRLMALGACHRHSRLRHVSHRALVQTGTYLLSGNPGKPGAEGGRQEWRGAMRDFGMWPSNNFQFSGLLANDELVSALDRYCRERLASSLVDLCAVPERIPAF